VFESVASGVGIGSGVTASTRLRESIASGAGLGNGISTPTTQAQASATGAGQGIGEAISAEIPPKSLIHEYQAKNFTPSTWPDSEQSDDILNNGLTSSTINSQPAVSGDGVDDFGSDGTLDSFGSNTDTDFSIELVLKTTDRGACFGVADSGMAFSVRTDSAFNARPDKISIVLSSDGTTGEATVVSSDTTVTDGTARHIIINKTGNSVGDFDIIINNTVDSVTSRLNNFIPSNVSNFSLPLSYFASNFQGNTPAGLIQADMGFIRLYNDSLTTQQQQKLFTKQPYV
jgi:hypothetical protein